MTSVLSARGVRASELISFVTSYMLKGKQMWCKGEGLVNWTSTTVRAEGHKSHYEVDQRLSLEGEKARQSFENLWLFYFLNCKSSSPIGSPQGFGLSNDSAAALHVINGCRLTPGVKCRIGSGSCGIWSGRQKFVFSHDLKIHIVPLENVFFHKLVIFMNKIPLKVYHTYLTEIVFKLKTEEMPVQRENCHEN